MSESSKRLVNTEKKPTSEKVSDGIRTAAWLGFIGTLPALGIYGAVNDHLRNNEAQEQVANILQNKGTHLELGKDAKSVTFTTIPKDELSRIQSNSDKWWDNNSRPEYDHEPFKFTVSQTNTESTGPYVILGPLRGLGLGSKEVTSSTQNFKIADVSDDEIKDGHFTVNLITTKEVEDIKASLVYSKKTDDLALVFEFGDKAPQEAEFVAVIDEGREQPQ